jgi:ABC-2 type transport system ATP-binding protein
VLRGLGLALEAAGPGTVVGLAPAHDGDRPPSAGGPPAAPAPEDVVAALVAAGVRVRGFSAEAVTLEERFVELTGEGFDVAQ